MPPGAGIAARVVRVGLSTVWLAACSGIPSSGAPEAGPPQDREALRSYLKGADQLNDEQRRAMLEGRPFEGMSAFEADLAMRRLETQVLLDQNALRATYLGQGELRYHVEFQGDPARVVGWSLFAEDEVALPDPKELRPEPPFPLPRH